MNAPWLTPAGRKSTGLLTALLLFIACFLHDGSAGAVCETPGTFGLVGHWRLDETSGNADDTSVNSNTGTIGTNPADPAWSSSGGIVAGSLVFDGNDTLRIANNATLNFGTGDFTVAGWVKGDFTPPNSSAGEYPVLYEKFDDAASDFGFRINLAENGVNRPRCSVVTNVPANNSYYDAQGTTAVLDGNWHHIACVIDKAGAGTTIYVDGIPEATSDPGWTGSTDTTLDASIGYSREYTSDYFAGDIDDVRVFNRALSSAEIQAIFLQRSNAAPAAGEMTYNTMSGQMMYCDGTDWRMMGTGSYNSNAADFDGTNDWLTLSAGLTDVTDSKTATISFWAYAETLTGSGQNYIFNSQGDSFLIRYNTAAGSKFQIIAKDSGGTIRLDFRCTQSPTTGQWYHVLISYDMSDASKRSCYLNNVLTWDSPVFQNFNLDYTATSHRVGAYDAAGALKWDGYLADLWIDFGTYIDLSVEANRRKFISAAGMPMYLGPDGSIPTGTAPDIFLTGHTDTWHTNKGTGGGFTENGALTTSSTRPADSILTSGTWSQIGIDTNFAMERADFAALTANTIAFIDQSNDNLRTYSWDGHLWTQTGTGLAISGVTNPKLTALSNSNVAFVDQGNDSLRTYSWSGSNWSLVGSGLTISGLSSPAIESLDSATIALVDDTANTLATYIWDGNSWSVTGNALTIANLTLPAVTALSENTIAYIDDTNGSLRTYRWDGTDWAQVGAGLAITVNNPAITAIDAYHIALIEQTNDNLQLYKWDGATWAALGSALNITGTTTPAIAKFNQSDIVFVDATNDDIRTYRFNRCLTKGKMEYSLGFNVMQYCNGVEWVPMGDVGGSTPAGQVAHWKLDETSGAGTAADSQGSNNGTLTNMNVNTAWVDGLVGNGLTFTGSANENVTIPSNAAFDSQRGTWSFWFKTSGDWGTDGTDNTDTAALISRADAVGANNGFVLAKSPYGGFIGGSPKNGSGSFMCWWNVNFPSGYGLEDTWHHIALIYTQITGEQGHLYINGELATSCTNSGPWTFNNQPILLGDAQDPWNEEFSGEMDDVRIFNRALSPDEIRQLYHFGLSNGLGDVSGNCASPSGAEGTMIYNTTHNTMQYCNGERWVGIGR